MDQVKPHILFTSYVLQQYKSELEGEVLGLMAKETERSSFSPVFHSIQIYEGKSSETTTRIDLQILEIVENKPVRRIYCYFIDQRGNISWEPFVDGQRLYFLAFKNWLEYIRVTHFNRIRSRERAYFY